MSPSRHAVRYLGFRAHQKLAMRPSLLTQSDPDLHRVIMLGAVERVRTKMMTVAAIMAGAVAYPLEHRNRLGGHAANRCAHDRRHGLIDGPDSDRHPRHISTCDCGDRRGP